MNIKNFAVIGISHEILSMQEREEVIKQKPRVLFEELFQAGDIKAYVDLSTCLRVEFYLELEENKSLEDIQKRFPVQKGLQSKQGEEALLYLAKVVCGFFSVIKGEDQILAQVKQAYAKALEEEHSSKLCNIIFHKIIELGKKFRSKSNIAHQALSLEAISLRSIRERVPSLQNHKAEEVSNIYQVNMIDFREKYQWIAEADIIISATSASHIVLEYEKFLQYKQDKEYFMLDLAVPRDIDPRIADLEKIEVLNLDDIWKISKEHS